MATLTETIHAGAFIVSEAPGYYSRDTGTIAVSQTILAGQVLYASGVAANITSSAAADAGNTGNGTLTLDVTAPVAAGAQNGKYRAVCIAVAANGGTFAVFDPSGVEIGKVAVAATFNNQIKFVIADGATDFASGDAFTITVGRESGADEQFSALPNDGSQVAAAIAVYPVTTDGSTTAKIAVMRRMAEVRLSDLTFATSISAANKAKAIEELRASGIIVR
ncbi:head decoration protein [Bradyrhizobium cenepequi]